MSATNWSSTHPTAVVQRSIFMDDHVYSIAKEIMRVQKLGAEVSAVERLD